MKFYAVGTHQVKSLDGAHTTKNVLLVQDHWTARHIAEDEARSYCKKERIRFEGVYKEKTKADNGGTMTKGIKSQKAKKHQLQERKRRAALSW